MVFQKGNKAHLGFKHSKETKLKMSEAKKDYIPWMKGKHHTEEAKKRLSEAQKGLKHPEEQNRNHSEAMKGKNNPNWKGGITPLTRTIRNSKEYKEWRLMVFGRDNFTCQECNKRGVYLHAHHIKNFSIILEEYKITTLEEALLCDEFWNINNGITFCKKCHKKYKI